MRYLLATLLFACGTLTLADSPWDAVSEAERETLEAIEMTTQALDSWMDVENRGFCPKDDQPIFELRAILDELPSDRRISLRQTIDGFGQPITAWCQGSDWAVISHGADGVANAEYLGRLPDGGSQGDDILMVNGELRSNIDRLNDALEFSRQRQTLTDMRSLAIVLQAYAIDNETLPGAPVQEMTQFYKIEPLVAPIYIRRLPLRDGWGHRFVYWHDGSQFRIASPGADGQFEADYTSATGMGEFDRTEYERDIVFSDAEFEQWPSGVTP